MLSKALALTSVAALAGQSLALNPHRRLHQQNDKRALEVVYETVWHTVYVSDCDASTEAALPAASTSAGHVLKPDSTISVTSTTTTHSTLTIHAPTLSASQGPAASSPAAKPSSQQTTMITVVQSTPASDSTTLFSTPASTPSAAPPSSSAEAISSSAAPSSSQPASSSSSSAPEPSAAPVDTGMSAQGVSKRGMAYNDPSLANTFGDACPKCNWAYNWGSNPGALNAKHKYIPMLWGPGDDHSSGWAAAVDQAMAAGADRLLSFNEPDNAGQSNLSPADAAAAHAKFMNPYMGKVRIGAPAVTNSNLAGQGIQYLKSFMTACKALPGGCAVDFCAVHWYSPAEAKSTLFDHLEAAHQACDGKPIMLTEFAPFGDDATIDAFLRDVLPQLEATPYLEGYSYFMVNTNSLMADASTPSTFGRTYATL